MGRPNLTRHPKFQRLARALGDEALARGSLELMWEVAYQNGDPYLGDSADVEAAAHWQGEPGKLTKALYGAGGGIRVGFIEKAPGSSARRAVYRVHDLYDHAPEYVRKRLDREEARRESGRTLSEVRAEAARKRWKASKQTAASVETGADACNANGTPPSPSPSPTPSPTPSPAPEETAAATPPPPALPLEQPGRTKRKNGKPETAEGRAVREVWARIFQELRGAPYALATKGAAIADNQAAHGVFAAAGGDMSEVEYRVRAAIKNEKFPRIDTLCDLARHWVRFAPGPGEKGRRVYQRAPVYGRPGVPDGWKFFTADDQPVNEDGTGLGEYHRFLAECEANSREVPDLPSEPSSPALESEPLEPLPDDDGSASLTAAFRKRTT